MSDKAKEKIKNMSMYSKYGARKLTNIIEEYLENKIIDSIIDGDKVIEIKT